MAEWQEVQLLPGAIVGGWPACQDHADYAFGCFRKEDKLTESPNSIRAGGGSVGGEVLGATCEFRKVFHEGPSGGSPRAAPVRARSARALRPEGVSTPGGRAHGGPACEPGGKRLHAER